MSSPRVGVVRDSMQTNPRIVKAPVGRSRPTALSGPGPDFTFGISSHSRDGGVAEVLSSWRVHIQRPSCSHALAPDFVSLNRDAVRSGAVTSKKLSQYRAQVGVAKKQSHTPKSQAARRPQSSVEPPGGGSGLQRQRSTSPLADLLSHQYGQRWIQEQLTRSGSSAPPRRALGRVPDTRTSLLRKCGPAPGPNRPGVKAHGSAQEPGGPSSGVQDS